MADSSVGPPLASIGHIYDPNTYHYMRYTQGQENIVEKASFPRYKTREMSIPFTSFDPS